MVYIYICYTGSRTVIDGFTAVMTDYVHDPAVGRRLSFPNVRFLSGTGYDSLTGIFTCPISGMYVFEHTLFVNQLHYVVTSIRKNGELLVWIQGSGGNVDYYASGSGTTVVSLQAGDRVWVQIEDATSQAVFGGYFSSFVGYLVHAY